MYGMVIRVYIEQEIDYNSIISFINKLEKTNENLRTSDLHIKRYIDGPSGIELVRYAASAEQVPDEGDVKAKIYELLERDAVRYNILEVQVQKRDDVKVFRARGHSSPAVSSR